jgi:DNA-binding NarL/FixJ family response regulator
MQAENPHLDIHPLKQHGKSHMKQHSIVLADDHTLFRLGLKKILSERSDLEVVGEAGDGLELLGLLRRFAPELVILDVSMPKIRGIEVIHEIKMLYQELKILILTMHNDTDHLLQAISAGANGYLLKDDAEKDLFTAVDSVLRGRIFISRFLAEESRDDWVQIRRGSRQPDSSSPLTVREREVLKLIAEGKSSREIGSLLCISHRTVERHRANIMSKLRLNKAVDLVKYAIQRGYV